jgi:hypothetical protein
MQPYVGQGAAAPPPPSNHDEFIKSLVPSFLSIDVDGRVCRLESFSKVIAPGSRVGWIVASEQMALGSLGIPGLAYQPALAVHRPSRRAAPLLREAFAYRDRPLGTSHGRHVRK